MMMMTMTTTPSHDNTRTDTASIGGMTSSIADLNSESQPESYHDVLEDSSRTGGSEERGYRSGGSSGSINGAAKNGGTRTTTAGGHEELASRETQVIHRSRSCFLVYLFLSALAASITILIIARREEKNDLAAEFHDDASEIDEVSHYNARNIYNVVDGFSLSITSLTNYSGTQWPGFSVPHFHIRAQNLLSTVRASYVALAPIVSDTTRSVWEDYSVHNHDWVREELKKSELSPQESNIFLSQIPSRIHPEASSYHTANKTYLPLWQMTPLEIADVELVNHDLLTHPLFEGIFEYMVQTKEPVLSEAIPADLVSLFGSGRVTEDSVVQPQSILVQPVFEEFDEGSAIVAVLIVVLPWDIYFENLLNHGAEMLLVIENSCGDQFSYKIIGPDVHFLGEGDRHNRKFDDLFVTDFEPFPWHTEEHDTNVVNCHYTFFLYPTDDMERLHMTPRPYLLSAAVLIIFLGTSLTFGAYDWLVQRRQDKVMETARKSNAIVSSLFPAEVRDRLFFTLGRKRRKEKAFAVQRKKRTLAALAEAPKFRLSHFLHDESTGRRHTGGRAGEKNSFQNSFDDDDVELSKPIADLFPEATVMFGDIAGFTAWSSTREPTQVFTLLETLYRAFDHIARRRHVFKVETIGDCYVAVTGLPEPRSDHAVLMARFSRDCLETMKELTAKLETTLGPDTGDLGMRFGLHSGPVTAGVLRGEKSRFQLFGDTVNTASRMESTGKIDCIQLSEETADLIRQAGKEHWIEPRNGKIEAKGKGQLQTYWLKPRPSGRTASNSGQESDACIDITGESFPFTEFSEVVQKLDFRLSRSESSLHLSSEQGVRDDHRHQRLIEWNTDVLLRYLKLIVAARSSGGSKPAQNNSSGTTTTTAAVTTTETTRNSEDAAIIKRLESVLGRAGTVQDEVTEFVRLPKFNKSLAEHVLDANDIELNSANDIELNSDVVDQLRLYITEIAEDYRKNPFHNFEHASHVTMSVSKLLTRIVRGDVAPSDISKGRRVLLHKLHERTHGITSDPLTQFGVVFSALIHDVDHRGIPNFLLVEEDPTLAASYRNRSVAEQNSVDRAWGKLMESKFEKLRSCIYTTTSELQRFRYTVVNTVMATDIFDSEFAEQRKRRWDRCFDRAHHPVIGSNPRDDVNRKAAIVIEHLIQASDVAHTMQHWQIYRKWNEKLFKEMMLAHTTGRSPKDPSELWYQAELGFFDKYVIPLAKKLKQCGVFGVSSDEYLNYALENRREWSVRGKDLVSEWTVLYRPDSPTRITEAGQSSDSND